QLYDLDSQIAELDQKLSESKPKADKADISIKNAAKIEDWLARDPNWLDEIAVLSNKAPLGKDMMLTKLTTPTASIPRTSNLQIQAVVQTTDVGGRLPSAVRDERHTPRPKTSNDENKVAGFPVNIKTEVKISPPKPAAPAKKDAPTAPSPAKPNPPGSTQAADKTTSESPAQ